MAAGQEGGGVSGGGVGTGAGGAAEESTRALETLYPHLLGRRASLSVQLWGASLSVQLWGVSLSKVNTI